MTVAPPRSTITPNPLPREDLRKRVTTRLLEKVDPARSRHKPISLLRQEAQRLGEHLLEVEAPMFSSSDREQLLDEILADIPGFGPLDELFRDESVTEFMVLSHNQIIRRNTDSWLPTSIQFRDVEHYRHVLQRYLETGKPVGDAFQPGDRAFDVRLMNGFRLIAIVPPSAMDLPPQATFRRALVPSVAVPTPPPREMAAPSGVTKTADRSGTVPYPKVPVGSGISAGTLTNRMIDPWERAKQRIIERFVERLAANNVVDLSAVPVADLRKVIQAMVIESNDLEKLHLDSLAQERLTLEILAHMHRPTS
ncbi:hypothetical protein BH11PLA2_BH11PLA2_16640 [soil metagenome]